MYILIVHSHQDNIGQMDLKRYDDKNAALSDTLAMIQRWSFHDTDNKVKITEWMTNTKRQQISKNNANVADYTPKFKIQY